MTRRSRRASSAPQRVGSQEGLTSSRPATPAGVSPDVEEPPASPSTEPEPEPEAEATDWTPRRASGRDATVEQTKDDTDEGWGERGEDDASARWLRENRPPHWS